MENLTIDNPDTRERVLGLDIGTTSIGWALLDYEQERMVDWGVRLFSDSRDPKVPNR